MGASVLMWEGHRVHWGINHPTSLSCQALLKSTNCLSPPFLGNPPYILVYCDPPLKSDFSVNPKNMEVLHR